VRCAAAAADPTPPKEHVVVTEVPLEPAVKADSIAIAQRGYDIPEDVSRGARPLLAIHARDVIKP
jgi:hypothetical protein